MRSDLTAPEQTLLETGEYDEHWRLKVANGDGTLIDVSTRLKSGTIHLPDPDAPIGTAEVTLWREINDDTGASLAPLVASSFNVLDDLVTPSPLLRIGRAATLEIAVTARGAARPAGGSALWHEVLGGFVKQPSWPKRYGDVSLELHDRAYKLKRTYIETPQTYESATTIEATIQATLDDTMGSGVYTLVVDDVAALGVTGSGLSQDYLSDIKPVWDAIQSLADSIGWVLWYRYDASGDAQLTLTEPRRAKTVSDYDFSLAQIADVTALTIVEEDVRNVVVVRYVDADGGERTVTSENAASITKYGGIRRYMRLSEDTDSPIRTLAAAEALRDAALSDVQDPDADQAIDTLGAWWPGEPSIDLYGFAANTYLYDSDQTFAPYSIDITFAQGTLSSATIRARGKPSAGSGTWISSHGGEPRDPVQIANAGSLSKVLFLEDTPTVGKVTIQWTRGPDVFEVWHYSTELVLPVAAADKPWPADGTAPDGVLSIGTDELVVDAPVAGSVLYVQMDTRDESAQPLKVYKYELRPKAVSTGADLPSNGDIIYGALAKSFQKYGYTGAFSNATATSVSWTGGTLTLTDGTTYTIDAGSATGLSGPTAPTYVYFDPTVSTTAFQKTATWSVAFGDTQILIATCWSGSVLANNVQSIGLLSLDGNAINPLSITTGLIAALAITAGKISVGSLSAISADIGTITAGTIGAAIIVASESFTAAVATFNGVTVEDQLIVEDLIRFTTSGAIQIEDGRIIELYDSFNVFRGDIRGDIAGYVLARGDWLHSGLLTTVATAIGSAGLNVPHGTAPTSPVDGDFWSTTAGLFARINGGTIGPLGGGGAGDITAVNITTNIGLLGSVNTASGDHVQTIDFDANSLVALASGLLATDHIVVSDGTVSKKALNSGIPLSIFNNDAGWTTNAGNITNVTAGTNLNGGGGSGSVTLNVDASPSFTNITITSDMRLKERLGDIDGAEALAAIEALDPMLYRMKDDDEGMVRAGLSAQAVQEVLPVVVSEHEETGMLGLDYGKGILVHIVAAIGEIMRRVRALEAKS